MGLNLLTVLVLIGGFYVVSGQQDWPYYHPQWESNGEPWDGNCDRPTYECTPEDPWPCWEPPFCPYDQIRVNIPNQGIVVGRSMVFWPYRYVNWYLGIPYAKPPVLERRFKQPEELGPGWDLGVREWDASFYRPACPQEIWKIEDRFAEYRNVSEDCLYLNIFRPNFTDRSDDRNRNYPVMVFIHGEDYKLGDAQLYPAHVLAKKEVVVVTFNYRLGALGFMSTLDHNAPGNYGIYDVLKVLQYVQDHISRFGGDPNKVTLVGSASGAAIAGLLTLSPLSYYNGYRPLFHRVIMMSGSDLCEWATIQPVWNVDAHEYAKLLGKKVGCDPYYGLPMDMMVECLRFKHYEEIVNASAALGKKYGSLAGPFGPVVDGSGGVLPDLPVNLRNSKSFMKVPVLAGVNMDEGAFIVDELTKDIIGLNMDEGMDPGTFRDIVYEMIKARQASIRNYEEAVDAIEFEYTYWAKPDNKTAVRQNLIDLWSDMMYGWCVDAVLKDHAKEDQDDIYTEPEVYFYVFNHRSQYEPLPEWMGVPHGKDVEYLFGFPFQNNTFGNLTGLVQTQLEYDYLDKNISEFVQDMWLNFTKYGVPTVEWTRNVSWYPMSLVNLSYLEITEFAFMDINFRQNHYGFWSTYFPELSSHDLITTTPGPTPRPMIEYQIMTYSMLGASLIIIFVIGALGITLWRRRKSADDNYK